MFLMNRRISKPYTIIMYCDSILKCCTVDSTNMSVIRMNDQIMRLQCMWVHDVTNILICMLTLPICPSQEWMGGWWNSASPL